MPKGRPRKLPGPASGPPRTAAAAAGGGGGPGGMAAYATAQVAGGRGAAEAFTKVTCTDDPGRGRR
jgi:hypothetical protein